MHAAEVLLLPFDQLSGMHTLLFGYHLRFARKQRASPWWSDSTNGWSINFIVEIIMKIQFSDFNQNDQDNYDKEDCSL